ncbi:MAG: peroxiredoxin [Candidatus Dadabacteria bacterium]|nr:MAG: peroxiredoxin [Candidatus Dadabacteria bacterium]
MMNILACFRFALPLLLIGFLVVGCHEDSNSNNDETRSIDGSGNNLQDPLMGATFIELLRLVFSDYADGISEIPEAGLPSARVVSNIVSSQDELIPNTLNASDYVWQWGQFVDHDIDLTDGVNPPEPADIPVPAGDPFFDPLDTGTQVIAFNRSVFDTSTGTGIDNPRQQINKITAWIDASNVYGSDVERAIALRTNDGTGRLNTSAGDLLPFNTEGLPNDGGPDPSLFLAGDVRSNEQVGLTSMHTLFVREHNRYVEELAAERPGLSGDRLYERGRRFVGALMQAITYNEFLPALLGEGTIPAYNGYNPNVNASIANIFSAAAYRFGHSMLSPEILRLDQNLNVIPEGNLPLLDAFFTPETITDEGGIDPILRGLAKQITQRVDPFIIDAVRNFLFGPPGSGGLDLAALNIQRGRDHGLPKYNDTREQMGLTRVESFQDISSDPEIQMRLEDAFGNVDDIDIWTGGLSEDLVPGSHLGEVFHLIIKIQFEFLRDGDRFWYERKLSGAELQEVQVTQLSDVIRRNTSIGFELQDNVFLVP